MLVLRPDYRLALRDVLEHVEAQSLLAAAPLLQDVEMAIAPGFRHLPLIESDALVHGEPVTYFRNWINRPDVSDPMWQEVEQAVDMARINAPVHLVGGWYDFFLRGLLNDYAALRAAGKEPYLTVGPWHHFSDGMVMLAGLRAGLDWFDAHLKDCRERLRSQPVRIFVMGVGEWRDLPAWPPPARETRLYLRSGRSLTPEGPHRGEVSDSYRYDPADPTPVIGGAQFSPLAGPINNRRLEARRDVLVYTSPPLARDLEVIGPVRLELFAQSSREHTDFFGRLCDVSPDGRSINICDGLFRTRTGREIGCIPVDMWSTAYRFRAGHRVRLVVASGAHPRWSRNTGSGEPDATGTTLYPADQIIYHDADHPSSLVLPVTAGWL
jgi:putative CocE/NonD family hydrolase